MVKLPSTLKKIECRAFKECRNLKKVEFPESLEAIEAEAFSGTGLKEF